MVLDGNYATARPTTLAVCSNENPATVVVGERWRIGAEREVVTVGVAEERFGYYFAVTKSGADNMASGIVEVDVTVM